MSSEQSALSAFQALVAPLDLAATTFPVTSRYHGIALAQRTRTDGSVVTFVKRRFVPPPESFTLLHEVAVARGDRLDKLAADFFGDPQSFWKLCDANGAMRPSELTDTVGRLLRITLPEGIPGGTVG